MSVKGDDMKKYVCIEHGEIFILSAETKDEASEDAQMYGGECIRELTKAEYDSETGQGGFAIKL